MRSLPSIPDLAEAPDGFFDSGHFWIQEHVDGVHLGFEMEESGLLRFGLSGTPIDPGDPPPHLESAVETVQDQFERDRLRDAVETVDRYTFVGAVPLGGRMEYRWTKMPAFLGTDIWDVEGDEFLSPDATHRIFEELGLEPIHVYEKEVPARRLHPDGYRIPESAYASEPAAGVRFRKKGGGSVKLTRPLEGGSGFSETDELEGRIEASVTATFLEETCRRSNRDPSTVSVSELAPMVARRLAREGYWRFEGVLREQPDRFREVVEAVVTSRWREEPDRR
ncbi:MAG: hypothetical protein ABEI31_06725 [Halodesulfurarchaeum sp.]